jgi:hypothetical protein
LEDIGLADVHLNRIRPGFHEGTHHGGHVFQAIKEGKLVEDTVVDGDIQAAAISAKETIETGFVGIEHSGCWLFGLVESDAEFVLQDFE